MTVVVLVPIVQRTIEFAVNPLPFSVSVKPAEPAAAVDG